MTIRFGALAVLLTLCLAAPAQAGFKQLELSLPGKVLEALVAELDGAPGPELLVLYRVGTWPDLRLRLRIFSGTRPEAKPLAEIAPPAQAAFFDLADVDHDGQDELLYLTAGSVLCQEPFGGEVRKLVELSSFALAPDPRGMPYQDFAADFTGEGRPALLVPARDRLVLFKLDDQGTYQRSCALELKLHAINRSEGQDPYGWSWGSYESQLYVPRVLPTDVDGDGLQDLGLAFDDRVRVHRATRGPQGVTFGQKPLFERRFAVRSAEELRLDNSVVRVFLTQIDDDGKADAVVLKYGGGLKDMTSYLAVFRGTGRGFSDAPDFSLSFAGVASNARIEDLDADGRADLVLPFVKIGVLEIIQALATGALDVDYNVYLFKPRGLYAARPDLTVTATYLADYRTGISLVGISPDFSGDYDRDGRPDLLYGLDKRRTAVSLGRDGRLFKTPDHTFEAVPASRVLVRDFSGDGRDDLIYLYTDNPDLESKIRLFINDGIW